MEKTIRNNTRRWNYKNIEDKLKLNYYFNLVILLYMTDIVKRSNITTLTELDTLVSKVPSEPNGISNPWVTFSWKNSFMVSVILQTQWWGKVRKEKDRYYCQVGNINKYFDKKEDIKSFLRNYCK